MASKQREMDDQMNVVITRQDDIGGDLKVILELLMQKP